MNRALFFFGRVDGEGEETGGNESSGNEIRAEGTSGDQAGPEGDVESKESEPGA